MSEWDNRDVEKCALNRIELDRECDTVRKNLEGDIKAGRKKVYRHIYASDTGDIILAGACFSGSGILHNVSRECNEVQ
jgi:hypothetical protein